MDELTFEREYLARGYSCVAGVDEVGRGPLAGPVVCAAVILPLEEERRIAGIDDSKKLSAKKREALAERIKEVARAYSIAEVDERTIDGALRVSLSRYSTAEDIDALCQGLEDAARTLRH